MVILGVTAILDFSALTDTLIDSIAIVIYVTLIILGITMKKNRPLVSNTVTTEMSESDLKIKS